MKCAVVYYSHTGNAKRIAEAIEGRFGADMFFVEPAEPYGSFLSAVRRVIREHRISEDPAPKSGGANLSGYDLIFLGFPVWADEMPRFLRRYVRGCKLSGKRVIPFVTAMGTGRDSALRSVRALLPDAEVSDYFYTNLRDKPDLNAWLDGIAAKYGG